jgi:hypothetical protein
MTDPGHRAKEIANMMPANQNHDSRCVAHPWILSSSVFIGGNLLPEATIPE